MISSFSNKKGDCLQWNILNNVSLTCYKLSNCLMLLLYLYNPYFKMGNWIMINRRLLLSMSLRMYTDLPCIFTCDDLTSWSSQFSVSIFFKILRRHSLNLMRIQVTDVVLIVGLILKTYFYL